MMRRKLTRVTLRLTSTETGLANVPKGTKLAAAIPRVVSNLEDININKVRLGKDISQRVMEDIEYGVEKMNKPGSEAMKENTGRELELLINSIERLQSNQYAVDYARDSEILIERQRNYTENLQTPTRLNLTYQSFYGMSLKEFNKLSAEEQTNIQKAFLDSEQQYINEARAVSIQRGHKNSKFTQMKMALSAFNNREQTKKELKKKIKAGEFAVVSELQNENVDSELYLDPPKAAIDTSIPSIYKSTSVRDTKGVEWNTRSTIRRAAYYCIMLSVMGIVCSIGFQDYSRQKDDGGFQGIYINNQRVA